MKKRLIDIYPPQTNQTAFVKEEVLLEDRQKVSKGTLVAIFLIVLFVVPPLSLHLFFARATILVWPQITKLHLEEHITAQVGYDKLNLEKKIVRARVFEEEKELMQFFPASGKKFKEEKARGTIRVYNESSMQPQPLLANTRFVSEDGKLFKLKAAASIPKGFLDVQIEAAVPGEEYNIGPSKFSLPGLVGSSSYTKIYGESLQAMIGGQQREVPVVTEEDIASAKDLIVETLKTEAVKSLLTKVPPPYQVLQDSLAVTVIENNSLVKPGAELNQFNYTARIRVAMSGFHKEDADVLAKHLLYSYLEPNQIVNANTLQMSYKTFKGAQEGGISLLVDLKADQYEKIDTKTLSAKMAGISKAQFRELISQYPFLAKTQFSLWPFWVSSIPKDSKRIHIDVNLNF